MSERERERERDVWPREAKSTYSVCSLKDLICLTEMNDKKHLRS